MAVRSLHATGGPVYTASRSLKIPQKIRNKKPHTQAYPVLENSPRLIQARLRPYDTQAASIRSRDNEADPDRNQLASARRESQHNCSRQLLLYGSAVRRRTIGTVPAAISVMRA